MRAALALLLSLVATAASAQGTVYRCGASYSATPCAEGRAVLVADARSSEEQRAAHDVARRERALADTLRRERLLEEREAARHGAVAGIGVGPRSLLPEAKPVAPAKRGGKGRKKLGYFADDPHVTQVIEQRAPKRKR